MRSASPLNQIHASADELAESFSAEQSVLEQGKVDELRNDGILFAVVRPNFFASVLLSGECFIHLFVLFFVVVGQFVILFVLLSCCKRRCDNSSGDAEHNSGY